MAYVSRPTMQEKPKSKGLWRGLSKSIEMIPTLISDPSINATEPSSSCNGPLFCRLEFQQRRMQNDCKMEELLLKSNSDEEERKTEKENYFLLKRSKIQIGQNR